MANKNTYVYKNDDGTGAVKTYEVGDKVNVRYESFTGRKDWSTIEYVIIDLLDDVIVVEHPLSWDRESFSPEDVRHHDWRREYIVRDCTCDGYTLFHFGCKCGFIKKDKK